MNKVSRIFPVRRPLRCEKLISLIVFFGRHLPGLRAQIFLVAGVMKMSWKKFLMVDGTSALFTITLWGGLGYVGGNSVQTLKKDIANIGQIVMVILAILVGSWLLFRYLKKRRSRSRRKRLLPERLFHRLRVNPPSNFRLLLRT